MNLDCLGKTVLSVFSYKFNNLFFCEAAGATSPPILFPLHLFRLKFALLRCLEFSGKYPSLGRRSSQETGSWRPLVLEITSNQNFFLIVFHRVSY